MMMDTGSDAGTQSSAKSINSWTALNFMETDSYSKYISDISDYILRWFNQQP